ncbi:MAG: L-fucose isomerase [Sphaerochaeta sp.]
MAKNRLKGEYPVIGIRPIIDARQGFMKVRDSLENQTMNMAIAAKNLIEERLHYSNGEPVNVIVADHSIGRVAEAASCRDKFEREGVEITISVTPCWCYGSETMDMDKNTIKAVWGMNATERPGAVYLAAVLAAHAQKGVPAFGIYGKDVLESDDIYIPKDVEEKLLRFAKAAVAAKTMRGKSYLQIGSSCMGIAGSQIDYNFFEEYLGMRVESIDEVEIIRRMEENLLDEKEYKKAIEWTKKYCKEGIDKNPKKIQSSSDKKEEQWEFVVKTALIIKDLMNGNENIKQEEEQLGHNAIAAGFQGQRQWTDFYPNCDFGEAILNTSFDWTGAREPYVLATENDTLNAVSMLFLKLLTNKAQMFSDVRTFWSVESVKNATGYNLEGVAKENGGFIHLINSGATALDATGACDKKIKEWWNVTEEDQLRVLNKTTWCAADNGYFRGGGFSSRFITEAQMPMTMVRINIVKGIGPVLQLAEGWTIDLPDDVSDKIWRRTDYTWPCTWFTPRCNGKKGPFKDAYSVMNNWGANHGAISYGHVGADIITMCSMLRIPVCMHNIDEDDIYRPASWNAFGMDKESQDYRACEVYGPLYK